MEGLNFPTIIILTKLRPGGNGCLNNLYPYYYSKLI